MPGTAWAAGTTSDDIIADEYFTSSYKIKSAYTNIVVSLSDSTYPTPNQSTPYYSLVAPFSSVISVTGQLQSSALSPSSQSAYVASGTTIYPSVYNSGTRNYILKCDLLVSPQTGSSFRLDGTFGMDYILRIQNTSTTPTGTWYQQHINRVQWFLYVNGNPVHYVTSDYGGVYFNSFTYDAGEPLTSIQLWGVVTLQPFVYPSGASTSNSRLHSQAHFVAKNSRLRCYIPDASVSLGGSMSAVVPPDISQPDGSTGPTAPEIDDSGGGGGGEENPSTPDYTQKFDDLNQTIKDGNEQTQQTIKDSTSEIMGDDSDPDNPTGIKGIISTIKNLPTLVLDGIVGLFVPTSEQIQQLRTQFEELFEGVVGFPVQIVRLFVSLFTGIAEAFHSGGPYQFHFPGIDFDFLGTHYTLVPSQDVSLDNSYMDICRPVAGTGFVLVSVIALFNMLVRLYNYFMGNDWYTVVSGKEDSSL